MTKKYDEMSLEELQAEKEKREKAKICADLQTQDDEIKRQAEEKARNQLKEEVKEEWLRDHPEFQPKVKVPDIGTQTKENANNENVYVNFYKSYKKRHSEFESMSQYNHKREELDKIRFQVYSNQGWTECGFDGLFGNTDADSGCEDVVDSWSPADTYAKVIWETFVCTADLLKICVKGLAINPGDGLGVQIRTFGAFGDPSSLHACECASCASISFSTYSLTLKQYNLEAIVCDMDIWDVGSVLMDSYLKSMANSWAQWFDAQIYSELETATPGTTETLPAALSCSPAIAGSCCTDASLTNLYNAINNLVASMREGAAPYNPDYLIISPTVAGIFKRMQTPTPMPWSFNDVSFDADGRLKKVAGLKVIEYCGANSCTNLSAQEVAIVIDSRRAVGCVFGQKPKTYKFFQTNCNSYRIDQWAYVAIGELDTNAIGHVVNP